MVEKSGTIRIAGLISKRPCRDDVAYNFLFLIHFLFSVHISAAFEQGMVTQIRGNWEVVVSPQHLHSVHVWFMFATHRGTIFDCFSRLGNCRITHWTKLEHPTGLFFSFLDASGIDVV